MNVYVSRDGETFGPYTDEQARQFLQSGQLLGSDYALYEGESEWKTLGDLLGVNQQTLSPNQLQQNPDQSSQPKQKKVVKKKVAGNKSTKVQMNRGQSSVVVKKQGILSRIFSTVIIFAVTCVVVCGAVAGLYFVFPEKVAPMLKVFGISTQNPAPNQANNVASVTEMKTTPNDNTLNGEDRQRLRSANIILLSTEDGDGLRVMSPVDKDQGLTDEDLDALIPISGQILSMDLTYARITDKGIVTLSKFENLRKLNLEGNTGVTAEGVANLKNLKNLSYLNLVRTKLNDEVVDVLISMENLREIYLFDTGLNEESITRLAEKRPKVFVNGG